MVDGNGGQAPAEGGAADAGTTAGAAAIAGGGGSAPEWLGALPDDLRGDATLSRYKSVEELGRAHIEAHKVAKSKLTVPAANAAPEAWGAVFDALGRPADAAGYGLTPGEGQSPEALGEFAGLAHKLGLLPAQAKALAEYDAQRLAAAKNAFMEAGNKEIETLKTQMGVEYPAKLAAAKALFAKAGFDGADAEELDLKLGSGKLVSGFMKLAELVGEHGRVDGADDFVMTASDANAEQQLTTLQKDKNWREKLAAGDATVVAQRARLLEAAKRQALSAAPAR
ncbi:hypothetical protein ACMT1E_04355 [Sphingomonas flavalba]|uniref:hypothetical protein n=1 Tax=Sphingomonas flavalba TaxID=2559804 RepID=UPI0039DFCDEC